MTNPIAFRKLFNLKYPLAWGDKKEKPDVFLTGVVISPANEIAKTKVQIQYFTAKSKAGSKVKLTNLNEPIVVKTDRSLLSDLGYTYALSRSVLKRGMTMARRDRQAIQQATQQEKGQKAQQSSGITPDNLGGIAFELRYNNRKVPVKKVTDGGKGPTYEAPPPSRGDKVTMYLTRLAEDSKTLGVVLKVNGRSTWDGEDYEPVKCKKWLYSSAKTNQPDLFEGYYDNVEGKNVRKFEVVTGKQAEEMAGELGERAGWIDLDVFASSDEDSEKEPMADPEDDDKKGGDEAEMKVSTRGMALKRGLKHRSLAMLQEKLRSANHLKLKKSKVIKRGEGGLILTETAPSDEVVIEKGALPNPVHLGHISIRYYKRDGKSVEPGKEKPDDDDEE
jgi:hypothetical protein